MRPVFSKANTLTRGGCLRKTAVGIISFAPSVVGVSAVALGALLAMGSPARSGSCPAPVSGATECSGEADSRNDETQTIAAGTGVTITDADDFGLNVGSGKGIAVTGSPTDPTIINLGGRITALEEAVGVDIRGTGEVDITLDGDITSRSSNDQKGRAISVSATGNTEGIEITAGGDIMSQQYGVYIIGGVGAITFTGTGQIDAEGIGVYVFTSNREAGKIEVTTADIDADGTAIRIVQGGSGGVTVTANENIDSDKGSGFIIRNSGDTTGAIVVTAKGDIDAETEGITISQRGAGAVTVTANGNVESDRDEGIRIQTHRDATGDVMLMANGDVTGSGGGIVVANEGSGDADIVISGKVTSESAVCAVCISGGEAEGKGHRRSSCKTAQASTVCCSRTASLELRFSNSQANSRISILVMLWALIASL